MAEYWITAPNIVRNFQVHMGHHLSHYFITFSWKPKFLIRLLIPYGIVDRHQRLEEYVASIFRVQEDTEETCERNWVGCKEYGQLRGSKGQVLVQGNMPVTVSMNT
jgi:hypothetical protein